MAQPEPSAGPIDVAAEAPPLLDIPNPRNYPPFDSRYIPAYSNNQLRYYQASGALLGVDDDELTRQINKRRTTLKATNWDGDTRENTPDDSAPGPTPPPPSTSRTLP